MKSGWRSNLLAVGISLLGSLLAAEAVLRVLRLGYNNAPLNPSASRHHEHPADYRFSAYSLQNEWEGFSIRTDRYGNRSLDGLCRFPPSGPSDHLVVLGDSFIEGFQVRNQDSITGQLQQAFCGGGTKVHNLGVSSYSPVLSDIQLREFLQQHPQGPALLQGGTVLHVLYDNDHVGDQGYADQLGLNDAGELVVSAEDELTPLVRLARSSYLARLLRRAQLTASELNRQTNGSKPLAAATPGGPPEPCRLDPKTLEASAAALGRIRDRVAASGGRYVLSAIPTDPRKGPTVVACYSQLAEQLGVPFIPVSEPLLRQPQAFYFTHDIHLNPAGNRRVADQLLHGLSTGQ